MAQRPQNNVDYLPSMRDLPTPPIPPLPVPPIPPSSPPGSDLDPDSPTARIHAYLASRGLQPTAENVRTVLQHQYMNQPDVSGVVTEQPPGPDSGPGVGQRGNVANKVESSGRTGPAGPVDRHDDQQTSNASKNTSAQPGDGLDLSNLGALIAGGAATGTGYYLGSRAGRGTTTTDGEFVGNTPPGPSGRVTDVNPPGIGGPGDQYAVLPGPEGSGATTTPGATPPATPSPMEMAMQKAIAPPAGVPQPGGGAPVDIPPYVSDPASIINAGRGLPPGVTPADAAVAARTDFSVDPAASRVGVPEMPPFTSSQPGGSRFVPQVAAAPVPASRTGTEAIIAAGKRGVPGALSILGRR